MKGQKPPGTSRRIAHLEAEVAKLKAQVGLLLATQQVILATSKAVKERLDALLVASAPGPKEES